MLSAQGWNGLVFGLLFFGVALGSFSLRAQISDEPFLQSESPTKNVDKDVRVYHGEHTSKEKPVRFLIQKDTRGTLSGNKCVFDATHEMGFEYITLTKGDPGYENEWNRSRHNFGVKTYLFFTRGPFWKSKVKKKIDECRYRTGDYAG